MEVLMTDYHETIQLNNKINKMERVTEYKMRNNIVIETLKQNELKILCYHELELLACPL